MIVRRQEGRPAVETKSSNRQRFSVAVDMTSVVGIVLMVVVFASLTCSYAISREIGGLNEPNVVVDDDDNAILTKKV